MSRSFDELVTSTEHAQPVHPVKALFQNHFYLDDLVSTEGGMWILMTDALLLVPLVMAAFFYPDGRVDRSRYVVAGFVPGLRRLRDLETAAHLGSEMGSGVVFGGHCQPFARARAVSQFGCGWLRR